MAPFSHKSSFDVTKITAGKNQPYQDWIRSWPNVSINGSPLSQIILDIYDERAKEFFTQAAENRKNNLSITQKETFGSTAITCMAKELFQDDAHVQAFIQHYLLADVKDRKHAEAMAAKVMPLSHAAGLLAPVSAAASVGVKKASNDSLTLSAHYSVEGKDGRHTQHTSRDSQVFFLTTPSGFTVQENLEQLTLTNGSEMTRAPDVCGGKPYLFPDQGASYVLKATAKVHVSLPDAENALAMVATDSLTDYGSEVAKKCLSTFSLGQWLSNLFNRLLGKNRPADLSKPAGPVKAISVGHLQHMMCAPPSPTLSARTLHEAPPPMPRSLTA